MRLTVIILFVASSLATPGLVTAAPLDAPPAATSRYGAAAQRQLARWHRFFDGGNCLIAERRVVPKLTRLGKLIARVRDRRDRFNMLAYFNQKLIIHANAQLKGVPGMGSWKQLDDRRAASVAKLRGLLPKKPASAPKLSSAQIRQFAGAVKAYRARAAADHKFVTALFKRSPCHRKNWPGGSTPKHLAGFRHWQRDVLPREVDDRLNKALKQVMPRSSAHTRGEGFLKQWANKLPSRQADYGELLRAAVGIYRDLQKDTWVFDALKVWSEALPKAQTVIIRETLASVARVRDGVAAKYAKHIAEVRPSKRVRGGREARAGRRLVRKRFRRVAGWRVTARMKRVKRTKTAVVKKRGRSYAIKYTEAFNAFSLEAVVKQKPYKWFIDMPGVAVKDVCALHWGRARYYTRGRKVKLRRWQLESHMMTPMLCQHK